MLCSGNNDTEGRYQSHSKFWTSDLTQTASQRGRGLVSGKKFMSVDKSNTVSDSVDEADVCNREDAVHEQHRVVNEQLTAIIPAVVEINCIVDNTSYLKRVHYLHTAHVKMQILLRLCMIESLVVMSKIIIGRWINSYISPAMIVKL